MRYHKHTCRSRHHMAHRGPDHHRGRGRRKKRPLGHGDLRLIILDLISTEPRHGYGLMSEIEARTSGRYLPSPGVIYPALEVLQDTGFIEARLVDGKKLMQLTPAGQTELDEHADELAAIQQRLDALSDGEVAPDPDDVRAAMKRLRHTIIRAARTAHFTGKRRTDIAGRLNALSDEIEASISG